MQENEKNEYLACDGKIYKKPNHIFRTIKNKNNNWLKCSNGCENTHDLFHIFIYNDKKYVFNQFVKNNITQYTIHPVIQYVVRADKNGVIPGEDINQLPQSVNIIVLRNIAKDLSKIIPNNSFYMNKQMYVTTVYIDDISITLNLNLI